MEKVSIIIPCYNEGEGLKDTFQELTRILEENLLTELYDYELLFVNDGSKDNTLLTIKELAVKSSKVKYISLSRNFGKEAGMLAGLKNATGSVFVIMDADLQHPPSLIPEMLRYYEKGYDQVVAKRSRKGEQFLRQWLSKTFYRLINKMIDVKLVDGVGDFRLLSERAVNSLLEIQENNRFSKGLFSWIGYQEKVIEYENIERSAGDSKWSYKSLINYAVDGMTSFNVKPLRFIIYLGVIISMLSVLYIFISFVKILLQGIDSPGYFTLISSILLLGGIQLISIGIIGEYVGRIFNEVKNRPIYIVEETNIEKNTK